jgi:hypothetical protein
MHQQPSIASIILLLARFIGTDLRRVSHPTFDSQLFHQLQEPLRRTTGFNPHPHRTWQPGVKLSHFLAFVLENVLFYFSRFSVQHRQRLLSRMQIAALYLVYICPIPALRGSWRADRVSAGGIEIYDRNHSAV